MTHLQELPTITLDDLASRAREIVRDLHGVEVITEKGQAIATLIPQPTADTLAALEPVLDALQAQVEALRDAVRRADSMNIAVEEFHYPTE